MRRRTYVRWWIIFPYFPAPGPDVVIAAVAGGRCRRRVPERRRGRSHVWCRAGLEEPARPTAAGPSDVPPSAGPSARWAMVSRRCVAYLGVDMVLGVSKCFSVCCNGSRRYAMFLGVPRAQIHRPLTPRSSWPRLETTTTPRYPVGLVPRTWCHPAAPRPAPRRSGSWQVRERELLQHPVAGPVGVELGLDEGQGGGGPGQCQRG